jgi:hypothetical protein
MVQERAIERSRCDNFANTECNSTEQKGGNAFGDSNTLGLF